MPTPQETHQQVITLKMQLNEQIIKPIKPILTTTKPIINSNPILTTSLNITPIIKPQTQLLTNKISTPINSNPLLTSSLNITPIIKPQTQVLTNKISTPINPNPLLSDGLLSVPIISSNYSTYLIIGGLIIGGFFFLKNN